MSKLLNGCIVFLGGSLPALLMK